MAEKKTEKLRLDNLLVERGLCETRTRAQAVILAGQVWSGETRLEKAGANVPADLPVEVRSTRPEFSSRAGDKLKHALESFSLSVEGKVCLDLGASTGGFTDCLLKYGAKQVFAVDVGYGQLDVNLRNHPQVTNVEKMNARHMKASDLMERNPLASEITFITGDVSFISLLMILPQIRREFPGAVDWVLLFKPQFEVGREHVGKGGLVRSEVAVTDALENFDRELTALGLTRRHGPERSPLPGKKSGNVEYLVHYVAE